jgi:cytochrome b561
MTDLKASPFKIQVYHWHKWLGLTVLALMVIRIAWRATHAPPPSLVVQRWQRWAAHTVHALLYLLLFALPLSGWLMNSAAGFPLTWFGLFRVPPLMERDREAFEALEDVHETLALGVLLLAAVHVAAALKHALIDRDGTLGRMGFGYRSRNGGG